MTTLLTGSGGRDLPDPHGRADRAIRFVESLRLSEGRFAGRRYRLADWQREIITRIYGDTDENGRRKVRTVFLLLPRANGKTTFAAALGLLHLFGPEREMAGQVIAAAADREQASICYGAAARMVQQDPTLSRITRNIESRRRIVHPKTGSFLQAISHEGRTKHGLSISCLIADEVHAWPTRELYDVLTTSMGKREQPLTICITTAGSGVHGVAWELYSYAKRVAAGEVDDPTFLPILFEPPPDADWKDESVWRAVNPAIDSGFRSIEEMRVQFRRACEVPAQRQAFRQLYLNFWSDGAAEPWLDMEAYDEGGEPIDYDDPDLTGGPCYLAVDLSATDDLTCVIAAWPQPDGSVIVRPHFFMPEANIERRERAAKVPYRLWREEGHMTCTPGQVVDYEAVIACVEGLAEAYDVREIAMDAWGAAYVINRLMDAGLPVFKFRQGYVSMSPAVKATERLILARKLRHGGHPVLRWNFQNVVLESDHADNRKFNKRRSIEKIDGAVACAMAVSRATAGLDDGDPYSSFGRGLLVL